MRITKLLPISRTAAAYWAWQNRDHLRSWAGFGARAAAQVASGSRDDTVAEGRLRVALARHPTTRRAGLLQVEVHDGVAELRGSATREAADLAVQLAGDTKGVRRVRDHVRVVDSRRRFGRR
jgi:osmotically-inducible protein OsmY